MPKPIFSSMFFAVGLAAVAGLPVAAQQSKTPAATQAKPAATTPAASATSSVSPLPGGASSLSEQHGDWTVSCGIAQNVKQCGLSQVLGTSDGKRALSVQLRPAPDNKVSGVILTQFGLRFDAGVRLTADDDKSVTGPLPFLTCIEGGCLVPVSLDTAAVDTLKSGKTLKLEAVAINGSGGQAINMTLSLNGFADALARTAELLK
ncbi:MAG: invasion associated locus B family protein [Rhizobiaceae bacterium]|nr:invasion associated locus B family protein [Rhizobiaceae bacterium]